MTLPAGDCPNSVWNTEEMSDTLPRLKQEYAMAAPTNAYRAQGARPQWKWDCAIAMWRAAGGSAATVSGGHGKFRFFVVPAEFDAAVAGAGEVRHEHHADAAHGVEEPADVAHRPREGGRGHVGHALGADNAPYDEGDDEHTSDTCNYLVHSEYVALIVDADAGDERRVEPMRVLGEVSAAGIGGGGHERSSLNKRKRFLPTVAT